jgi:RNA polymerase sigma factor (sigma-70 family)
LSLTDAAPVLTDPELISRVREGDVDAYGTLFARHVDAAARLARLLVNTSDADDLVSEAFVKVLNVLLGGGGPDVAFRAYLLTAVRRLHIDKVRSTQRATPTDDLAPFDPGVPFTDTAVAGFEGGAAAKAFASLPERWQMVLWHLEVENQKPADIALLLGMTANSVSALAYRAREGLRQAYLNMHSADLVSDACRETNGLLGGYVRGALSRRDATRVEDHLEHCRPCTTAYLELSEVNSSLAAVLGPALLGGVAAVYLGGGAAGAGLGAGALVLLGRGKDFVLANAPVSAATAAAVGVVGVVGIAVVTRGPNEDPSAVEQSVAGGGLPSFASTPNSDRDGGAAPGRVRSQDPPAERGQGTSAGSNPVAGARGISTPTPAAQLLDSAGHLVVAPGAQSIPAAGPGPGRTTQPGDGPGRGPGPGPGGGHPGTNPIPDPKPTSKPTSKPTDPPKTSEPPPEPRADVGVTAGQEDSERRGRVTVWAQVTHVPKGTTVMLTATASTGDFHARSGGCHRSGRGYACTSTTEHSMFTFDANAHSRPTVRFTVTPPSGYTGDNNNSATVQVSGGRRSSG